MISVIPLAYIHIQRVQVFKEVDWPINQKLNACFFVNDKCELVFDITEIHASSQRFHGMTNQKNVSFAQPH